jgi:hypothetical protein
MSVGGYLSRFREATPHKWNEYATRISKTPSTTINDIFEKSYLAVKAKDPQALDLLTLCSFLAPNTSIPGKVLEYGAKESGERLLGCKVK